MKDRFIELAELVVDVAISQGKRPSLDRCSKESFPPEYKGRIKVRHADGTISDDNRFDPNFNIFPSVLSTMARKINQAMHSEYGYQFFEEDIDQEIVLPAKNPADILKKVENILSYATKHDCWNYDHFWNTNGQIKDKIYLKKSEARYFLDGNSIKYSSKLDETFDVLVEQQPHETDQQFCERLKNEGKKSHIIARELKKNIRE